MALSQTLSNIAASKHKAKAKKELGPLNAKQHEKYATVQSGGQGKFPIPDPNHARAALSRLNQAKPPLSPGQKATVRAKANAMLGKGK